GQRASQPPDQGADHRAQEEADAPAEVEREYPRVEQDVLPERADDGAEPVRPVDGQVGVPAVLRGDELVDGGVDRGVLTADARAREAVDRNERPVADTA